MAVWGLMQMVSGDGESLVFGGGGDGGCEGTKENVTPQL
jgi:hypothetical protein